MNRKANRKERRRRRHEKQVTAFGNAPDGLMTDAVAAFQASRLEEAESLLQRILKSHPRLPDALHLLGLVVHVKGDNTRAVDLIAQAIEGAGDNPLFHHNQGIVLRALGRLPEAEAAQRRALDLQPDHAEACNHLGGLLQAQGRAAEAEAAYRRAIGLRPEDHRYYNNLGILLREQGRFEAAAASLREAVSRCPEHPAAQANLGAVLLELGDVEGSEAACRRALELDPQDADTLNIMAVVMWTKEDLHGAADLFRRAIALAPRRPEFYVGLGKVLKDGGDPEGAAAACRKALAIDPDLAGAHTGLGIALVDSGHIDEAIACFRRALAIEPDNLGAFYQLSVSGSAELGDQDISRMTNLLAVDRLPPKMRTTLHFALANAYERRGDAQQAFVHYRKGNERRRDALAVTGDGFDADADERLVSRIVAAFDGAFFAAPQSFGDSSALPVFIVGMPRSGTTLVEQVIASHPRAHGAGELTDITQLTKRLPDILETDAAYPECATRLRPAISARLAREYLDRLRTLAPDADRVTDKNPYNFRHLGLIAALFPGARVVHCRRDPRDTALSCYLNNLEAPWSMDLDDIGRYYRCYQNLMVHWRDVLPLPVLEVVYEELIADQEGESRRLIDFLGLPWDPACLAFHKTERAVLTASSWQVRRPLYAASVGRWRAFREFLGPLQMPLD